MKQVASVALVGLCFVPASRADGQALEPVLARAAAYVDAYERDLGIVIADERYEQHAFVQENDLTSRPRTRLLVSEFLLLRVRGATDQWLGLRDVLTVDNRKVSERSPRLQQLLASEPETLIARSQVITAEGARFNLGDVARAVNVPTLALLVLRAEHQPRFAFVKDGERRLDGLLVWAIGFEERAAPALIRDQAGRDLPARGTVWIDPDTGRVLRTELRTEDAETRVGTRITVSYRPDPDLGVWVPHEMTERYIADRSHLVRPQRIYGVAQYSNFRRFEPAAALRPPS